MTGKVVAGPERPTIAEKFAGIFHTPYVVGCLVLAAIVGPVGQIVARYLASFDLVEAIRATFSAGDPSALGPTVQGVLDQVTFFLYLAYGLYAIRYMRTKVVDAEPQLQSLSSRGNEAFRNSFARLSSATPPAIITLLLTPTLVVFLATAIGENIIYVIYQVISTLILFVVLSTFLWVYYSALNGLRKIGTEPLRLKPYYEDTMLGTRPIGSLALSLAFVYFGGFLIIFVGNAISADVFYISLVGAFAILGVVLFFLPLVAVHRKMVEERRRWQYAIHQQLSQLPDAISGVSLAKTGQATLDDLRGEMTFIARLLAMQVTKEDVKAMPTWPFDTTTLGRLTIIVLSVIAAIIARLIEVASGSLK